MNKRKAMRMYSPELFEKWVKEASPEFKEWHEKEIEYLQKNIVPSSSILDVGCGFGRHIEVLAPLSEKVIGVDNNYNMIKQAKEKLSKYKNVELYVQDAHKLHFSDDSFDYVICMGNTFGQIPNTLKALKEMKRVTKKRGTLIISVCSENSLKYRVNDCKRLGLRITKIADGKICTTDGVVSEQFTKYQLGELFNRTDLSYETIGLNEVSYLCRALKK